MVFIIIDKCLLGTILRDIWVDFQLFEYMKRDHAVHISV